MGADSGMSSSLSRFSFMPSPEVLQLPQCLPLDPISLGSQKYTRSGELRRALGFPLGSAPEDHLFRASGFNKPSPPLATEELKQIKENVLDASTKARERSKMFNESMYKIDKYREAAGSKKRQRNEILSNERPGASSMLKMAGQPRNLLDQSAQRSEDKTKYTGLNKRFRSDPKVDGRSVSLSKDQISGEKDTNFSKPVVVAPVHPEDKTRRQSSVGEGWDRTRRKPRSVGASLNKTTDGDVKRTMHAKLSTDSKLASCDTSILRSNVTLSIPSGIPTTVLKGKISRAPRTGSVMLVNPTNGQAASEASERGEQPTNTNKVVSLGTMQNHSQTENSSQAIGKWVVPTKQKNSRSRRANVLSSVSNLDEVHISSLGSPSPGNGAKITVNSTSGCLGTVDEHINTPKVKSMLESVPSPVPLSEGEETKRLDHKLEEKGPDCRDVILSGKGKVRPFHIPMKRNKNVVKDHLVDGMRKQGRTMRGSSLLRPGIQQCETKFENVCLMKPVQNMKPASDKIRSKTGRPPSKKISDGRVFTRSAESDDDHEELLLAAANARKAGYHSCTGRFWKKMEPIFGSVSLQDATYLKQQLSLIQEIEDSLSDIQGSGYNILSVLQHTDKDSHCNPAADKDRPSEGLFERRKLGDFSSLYQRVLSALIDEDESEGIYTGSEGVGISFQCASDDSHCGSSNYTDTETKDRDRFESEAESIVDFQIQKRCPGDRLSCNKSATSNTTKNASLSDSLYSSGRWLGDDGLSHSDVEFVSVSCQMDQSGVQPLEVTVPGTYSDSQYQLMCVDDRLILELQSIGLYLDTLPDLTEGEEVIDRDIAELTDGLSGQVGKRKKNLVDIDRAIEDDREKERRYMEQVAMEQLIQMAYKSQMACRRNNASKAVMRKVSKQVAMGFIERTLTRYKKFELTGRSCFGVPSLQNVLFGAPMVSDGGANVASDGHTSVGAPKHRIDTAKSDSTSVSMLDDLGRGSIDSPGIVAHSSPNGFLITDAVSQKSKKKELLLDDVGGASSRDAAAAASSLVKGKGKRSERDRDHTRGTGSNLRSRDTGLVSSGSGPNDTCEEEEEPLDYANFPMPDFTLDQLDDHANEPQDIGSWFEGLQDHDSEGLHIPMDDLSMIL